ncbi:unnamed protein product [Paramecium sonneborni]|uniref:Uncharacterized protein n=1 Tax=Paramecium sonneborni TaxID=65129 RepID=A0A8S1PH31_9CILI|nr:unnamed protein product [Paramecium sonneborni]
MINFDTSNYNIGVQIPAINYNPGIQIFQMFSYIQQCGIDPSQIDLTIDGQYIFDISDQNFISQYFNQDTTLYILPKQQQQQAQPTFQVWVDGQQVLSQQLQNMPISELLQGLNLGTNYNIDFYDGNGQLLMQNANQQSNLYDYANGQQLVNINLTTLQIQNNPNSNFGSNPNIGSNPGGKTGSSFNDASKLLESLILLKNVSLLIDPNGQFAVYKFHFPTLVQGYLQRSKGKDPSSFHGIHNYDWVKKHDIQYCSLDDYGFAIAWGDGNISSVKIKQQ